MFKSFMHTRLKSFKTMCSYVQMDFSKSAEKKFNFFFSFVLQTVFVKLKILWCYLFLAIFCMLVIKRTLEHLRRSYIQLGMKWFIAYDYALVGIFLLAQNTTGEHTYDVTHFVVKKLRARGYFSHSILFYIWVPMLIDVTIVFHIYRKLHKHVKIVPDICLGSCALSIYWMNEKIA